MATTKSVIISVAMLAMTAGEAAAINCPVGSMPWVDTWGNQICRSLGGGTTAIEGSLSECPIGTHPGVDSWGNQVCKSFQTPAAPSRQYYDTSRGCPIGTFEWTDMWGNATCKRF